MAFDLFAPIEPISAKIAADVPGLVAVGPVSLLTGTLQEITARLPGVFIRPASSNASSHPNVPSGFADEQDYEIVVAVPHGISNAPPETQAGPIAGAVIESLLGFIPTPQFQPLYYKGFGEASYLAGYAEFPLRFSVKMTHKKPN